jgi:putative tryptophan/tyrosine transport system substrate-binding protein
MRRRDLIVRVAGAAAALTVARTRASAQGSRPLLGWLSSVTPERTPYLPFFIHGLADLGYVEGRNIDLDYRWAEGDSTRLPTLAAELVRDRVAVIATASGSPAALAAKAATESIPIAFLTGDDPVKAGLVASLNRPGANVTGVAVLTTTLAAKQIELLHQVIPSAASIAVMIDPTTGGAEVADEARAAAVIGHRIVIAEASSEHEFAARFAALAREHVAGVVVPAVPVFARHHREIATLAAQYNVPAIFSEGAASGGVMTYGPDYADMFRQLAGYVARILAGTKPADLPVEQPMSIKFKINLKGAKAMGLDIPPSLLARADEVIE